MNLQEISKALSAGNWDELRSHLAALETNEQAIELREALLNRMVTGVLTKEKGKLNDVLTWVIREIIEGTRDPLTARAGLIARLYHTCGIFEQLRTGAPVEKITVSSVTELPEAEEAIA